MKYRQIITSEPLRVHGYLATHLLWCVVGLLVSVTILTGTGCASVGPYAKNRGNDFLDMFKIAGGYGVGLHADVEATDFLHFGVGGSKLTSGGLYGREVDKGNEFNINFLSFFLTIFLNLSMTMEMEEGNLRVPSFLIMHGHLERVKGTRTFIGKDIVENADNCCCFISPFLTYKSRPPFYRKKPKPFHRWFDFEAGATAGIIGVRVGFSPGEAMDFLLGIFTIDFAKDDQTPDTE